MLYTDIHNGRKLSQQMAFAWSLARRYTLVIVIQVHRIMAVRCCSLHVLKPSVSFKLFVHCTINIYLPFIVYCSCRDLKCVQTIPIQLGSQGLPQQR